MLVWNFAAMHRPSKANSVAGRMARHPATMPKQAGSDSYAYSIRVSRASAVPWNRRHPPSDTTKRAPENDKATQKAMSHPADETLSKGPELGTEVEELWRHRDRLSQLDDMPSRDGAAVIPTKLRQAVSDILGAAHRDARALTHRTADTAFGPGTDEDISEHAESGQVETQSHPRKQMVIPRAKAPARRQREYEREGADKATREQHRGMGDAGGRPKRTQKTLCEALRRESAPRTAHNARAKPRRNRKPSRADTPATSRQPEILPGPGLSLGGEGIGPGRLTPMARTPVPQRKARDHEEVNPRRCPG